MDEAKLSLIHAAEIEFAEKGIAGASVRAVTQRAGMNVASVNYHFGSKDELFKAMFLYRVEPINEERIGMLREARAASRDGTVSLELIAEILVRPMLKRIVSNDPSVVYFTRALNRFITECGEKFQEICVSAFEVFFNEILEAMQRHFLDTELKFITMRIHFCISMLMGTMSNTQLIGGQFHWMRGSFDQEDYIQGLIEATIGILRGSRYE